MSSSSSFRASSADDVRLAASAGLDEEDSYSGDGSRTTSQRFDSGRYDTFPIYADDKESSKGGSEDKAPYPTGDDIFSSQPMTTEAQDSPPSAFSAGGEFSPERSGNGPILPPPDEMLTEEGFALKEWRRLVDNSCFSFSSRCYAVYTHAEKGLYISLSICMYLVS